MEFHIVTFNLGLDSFACNCYLFLSNRFCIKHK